MSEPAVQLDGISEATEEIRGVAGQALEWVRVSEERVVDAEGRAAAAEEIARTLEAELEQATVKARADAAQAAEQTHAEVKQRAMEAVKKIGAEGRERIAAEREQRRAAESRVAAAEQARDRAEKAFEESRRRDEADREALAAEMIALKERSEEERLALVKERDARGRRSG